MQVFHKDIFHIFKYLIALKITERNYLYFRFNILYIIYKTYYILNIKNYECRTCLKFIEHNSLKNFVWFKLIPSENFQHFFHIKNIQKKSYFLQKKNHLTQRHLRIHFPILSANFVPQYKFYTYKIDNFVSPIRRRNK